jgi:hypothetical protein
MLRSVATWARPGSPVSSRNPGGDVVGVGGQRAGAAPVIAVEAAAGGIELAGPGDAERQAAEVRRRRG